MDTRKRCLTAAMPSPSGASTLQFLALSAHWSTAYSACGGGVASACSQAPAQPLAHPASVLRDRGENRKNESEKARGSR